LVVGFDKRLFAKKTQKGDGQSPEKKKREQEPIPKKVCGEENKKKQ